MATRMVELNKLLWAVEPKNYTGAACTAKYVSLKNYGHLTMMILTGAWAGGTAAVTLLQATDVSATGAKALSFAYQWNDVAASGTLVKTAVTADTFNLGTALKMYVIEIDAETLDLANDFDCVTIAVASPGANNDLYAVAYILPEAKYAQATPPTALTD